MWTECKEKRQSRGQTALSRRYAGRRSRVSTPALIHVLLTSRRDQDTLKRLRTCPCKQVERSSLPSPLRSASPTARTKDAPAAWPCPSSMLAPRPPADPSRPPTAPLCCSASERPTPGPAPGVSAFGPHCDTDPAARSFTHGRVSKPHAQGLVSPPLPGGTAVLRLQVRPGQTFKLSPA